MNLTSEYKLKNGQLLITVRMSSESAYDYYCFVLDPAVINESQIETAKVWIEELAKEIRTKHDPVEAEDDW